MKKKIFLILFGLFTALTSFAKPVKFGYANASRYTVWLVPSVNGKPDFTKECHGIESYDIASFYIDDSYDYFELINLDINTGTYDILFNRRLIIVEGRIAFLTRTNESENAVRYVIKF